MITAETIVVLSANQLSCDLGGEAAILGLEDGVYYGLDQVGADVWEMLREPRSVRDLCEGVMAQYDVEPEQCRHDVIALLDQLIAKGLVEIRNGTGEVRNGTAA